MLKDHLGNVRVLLTEEQQTDMYPAATMETATAAIEETYYSNLPATRIDVPSAYPANTPAGNAKVAKVSAAAGGNKIGPAIILKVMAGDKFSLNVNSWWKSTATPGTPVSPLTDLVNALANNVAGVSGGKATSGELISSGISNTAATNFLSSQSYNSSKPKAFINWVMLDEQFKYYAGGFEQVGASNVYTPHTRPNLDISKCGYLYIYVSNETPNIDVFFDNLQVTHVRGAMLETNEYYPFGLLMKNISYRSMKNGYAENKLMFNDGTELSSKEFNDGNGLELYATEYRSYDPQIGRFHQIDPLADMAESWSTYTFSLDNPLLFNDPLGLTADSTGNDTPTGKLAEVKTLPEVVLAPGKAKQNASTSSTTTGAVIVVVTTVVAEEAVTVAATIAPPVAALLGIVYLLSLVYVEPGAISVPLPCFGPIDNTYIRPPSSPRTILPPPPFYFAKDKDDKLKGG